MLQMLAVQLCIIQHKHSTNTQTNKCASKTKYVQIINNIKKSKFSFQKQVVKLLDVFTKIAKIEHCNNNNMLAIQLCIIQHKHSTNTQTNKCASKTKYVQIINNIKKSKFSFQKQVVKLLDVFTKIAQQNITTTLNICKAKKQYSNKPKKPVTIIYSD